MGWYLRKSKSFGPFRFNFSKSGIGVSAGVKGARIGTGPRGAYIHLGRGGIYYHQKLSDLERIFQGNSPEENSPSVPISDLAKEINAKIALSPLIQRPRSWLPWVLTALVFLAPVGLLLAAVLSFDPDFAAPFSSISGLICALAPISFFLFGFLAWRSHGSGHRRVKEWEMDLTQRRTTELRYDLDSRQSSDYTSVINSCYGLSLVGAVWLITSTSWLDDGRRTAGATTLVSRNKVIFTRLSLPYIETVVDVWGFQSSEGLFAFLPDRILVFRRGQYYTLSYDGISITVSETDVIDDSGQVPTDARIVGYTWKNQRVDGQQDMRFANNYQVPVVRYAVLNFGRPAETPMQLQVSNPQAANAMALALAAARSSLGH